MRRRCALLALLVLLALPLAAGAEDAFVVSDRAEIYRQEDLDPHVGPRVYLRCDYALQNTTDAPLLLQNVQVAYRKTDGTLLRTFSVPNIVPEVVPPGGKAYFSIVDSIVGATMAEEIAPAVVTYAYAETDESMLPVLISQSISYEWGQPSMLHLAVSLAEPDEGLLMAIGFYDQDHALQQIQFTRYMADDLLEMLSPEGAYAISVDLTRNKPRWDVLAAGGTCDVVLRPLTFHGATAAPAQDEGALVRILEQTCLDEETGYGTWLYTPFSITNTTDTPMDVPLCRVGVQDSAGGYLLTEQVQVFPPVLMPGATGYGVFDRIVFGLPYEQVGDTILTPVATPSDVKDFPVAPLIISDDETELDSCCWIIRTVVAIDNTAGEPFYDGVAVLATRDKAGALKAVTVETAKDYITNDPIYADPGIGRDFVIRVSPANDTIFGGSGDPTQSYGHSDGFVYSATGDCLFTYPYWEEEGY